MNPPHDRDALVRALALVARGEKTGLEEVYRRTSAKLFGVCLRILPERSEAEEVLQEVYLTVWEKAETFDAARASPMTWLITIARNRAIDRQRARKARPGTRPMVAADDIPDLAPDALDTLERADEQARLMECLRVLEDPQRQAIAQAFLRGCTYEELARRMDAPLGTVKSWIRRGLMKLRVCLEA